MVKDQPGAVEHLFILIAPRVESARLIVTTFPSTMADPKRAGGFPGKRKARQATETRGRRVERVV
jgi:hypothetical protein